MCSLHVLKPNNAVMPKVSVVIPSLNEEKSIGRVIQKVKETLEAMGLTYEIIVSDNSTDKTPEIARSMGATVVTPDRRGYGYAYLYAFPHARGDITVMADADDTYDMRELPKLLQPILKGKADLAICTRLKGKILKGAMPWHHRYIGNPLITWLLNRFYKVDVSDSQCGFRAFTRQVLEKLKLEATGMEFATDMLIKVRHAGLRIAEVPITYYPRAEGAPSKLNSFSDGWRHVEYILTYTPKHLYLYPGLALTTLGIALIATAIINAQIGYSPGIHTSITGGTATIIGSIADLTLAKRLGIQSHSITQKIKKHTPRKAGAIGVALVVIGVVYLTFIIFAWVKSGYRRLPLRDEKVIALPAIVLGIEQITNSIYIKINVIKSCRWYFQ